MEDLLIISQTTYSLEKFENIVEQVKEKTDNINLVVQNTICNATKQRQEETVQISKRVDLIIIIGGKHSSNTLKLYEIAKENCKQTILIETYEELDKKLFENYNKIGIMAGASTPKQSIDLVIEFLNNV